MGEIMDDSNAARGMALYGVIGGMGRFIAPLVGSIAVLPAKQFAKFGVPLEEFPFAIPSAMVAVSCAGVLLFAYFELQETLKNRQKLDPTDKMKKNELYRQKKKTLRRGSAEYSAISGTDLDLDPEMDNESPREKEEREREKEDGVFGSRPVSLRNGAGGGAGGIFTSTASSNSAFRAVSSTPSSSSLSSASRINENLPGVVRPMTALKKSLCLPLPLPLTSRHPFDVTDRHSDDLLQMSAPSTARIEESFPSHFRMLSDQSTTNTNTNTSTSSSISTNDENSLVRAGFLGADSVLDNLVVGRSGVRVCDTGADTSSALSAHGNGSRDLNHGNRMGSLDIQRNDFIDWEREDTAGLGLGEELGVGVGVECVSLGVGKSSDGLGMINRNIDGRAGDKMKRSEWGTAKQGRSRLDSDSDIDFLSQSDSRRVSFSSLVMVKVIGSSSLGIGQLKHLRPDDHPVEQADRRESGVGQGPGSVPQSPSIDTADSPSSSRYVQHSTRTIPVTSHR